MENVIPMFDGKEWSRNAPNPLPSEFDDFSKALGDAGYHLFDNYGAEWNPAIELWQHNENDSFFACVNSSDRWIGVLLPTTGAMLEFMRLYSWTFCGLQLLEDFHRKANEILDLLTEPDEGPLWPAQHSKWRREREQREQRLKKPTADHSPGTIKPPDVGGTGAGS
jgi:hypothetical protein